jgi:hypothetical protein
MNTEGPCAENKSLIENPERTGLSRRGFLHGMGGMGAIRTINNNKTTRQ